MRKNTGDPYRSGAGQQLMGIRETEIHIGSVRESESPIVPIELQGQHNLARGKGQCLHHVSEERMERRLRKC